MGAFVPQQRRLMVVPVSLAEAGEFITAHHRHHRRMKFHKFSVGVALADTGQLAGVAVVGRPISTVLDDGQTLEVSRTCTDGTPNANSALYGAAWRAGKAMGFARMVTYTQDGESGASMRAAGWVPIANRRPRGGWNMPNRARVDTHQVRIDRILWGIGTVEACNETPPAAPGICNETRCEAPGCSTVVDQPATGRRRRFCSGACRVRAHRARRVAS